MRCLIIMLHMVFSIPTWVFAQDAPGEIPKPPAPVAGSKSELFIVGRNQGTTPQDFIFKIGDSLQIKATGDIATKIQMELTKDTASKSLTLYFDGVKMANLPSSPLQIEDGKELRFNFDLVREANNEENRKAWDNPSAFPNPDEFRLDRDLRNHVAFGMGIHYCLGAPLARAEATITLNTFLDRFPVLKRGAAPAVRQTRVFSMFGFQQLPLVLASA